MATVTLLKRIPTDDRIDFDRQNEHSRALLRGMREEDQGLLQDQAQPSSTTYDENGNLHYGTVNQQRS